jgi:hypothetical protein
MTIATEKLTSIYKIKPRRSRAGGSVCITDCCFFAENQLRLINLIGRFPILFTLLPIYSEKTEKVTLRIKVFLNFLLCEIKFPTLLLT